MLPSRKKTGILYIGNFLSSSIGIRYVCEDLSDQLEARGWTVLRTSAFLKKPLRLLDMIKSTLIKRHFYTLAVVDVFSGDAFIWAETVCNLLRLIRKPYILVIHGGAMGDFAERWPGRVKRLLRSAAAVSTPSLFLKDILSPLRDDMHYIPNAIELNNYTFRLRSNPEPRLCWLRAFHNMYNPELAIKTLSLILNHFPSASLKMIGPDKGDGSLQRTQRLAEQLGVTPQLQIRGSLPKSNIPQVLNESDIFINTTRYESFGIAVMEAAADGLCIVSTNAGEIPFLWKDGHEALIVSGDNSSAMAEAIIRLLTEQGLAERLSRNARTRTEKFDWDEILPEWEDLLLSACNSK
jgi:glycosyltransferase involved in cell wall biosynthesis